MGTYAVLRVNYRGSGILGQDAITNLQDDLRDGLRQLIVGQLDTPEVYLYA